MTGAGLDLDATDAGGEPDAADPAALPERTCIVTRRKGAPDSLIRFALGPDRGVVPDIRAKLPGRGAWVEADAGRVAEAVRRKAFARAFKGEVGVPGDLPGLVDGLLEADALQALSLANKAGLVVTGSVKVEVFVARNPVAALLHARDGGEDGRRKLEAALRRGRGDDAAAAAKVQIFTSEQLSLALGRTNVIHAALAVGPAAAGFVSRSRRLERFRQDGRGAGGAAGTTHSSDE